MQPCLTVSILVLQAEGVVRRSRYVRFALQFAPTKIIPEPNQIVVLIGNLFREADFGRSGVVGLLTAFAFFGCPIADLCQRFVAARIGVNISISAVRLDFLQEMAAVPNEAGFLFEAV